MAVEESTPPLEKKAFSTGGSEARPRLTAPDESVVIRAYSLTLDHGYDGEPIQCTQVKIWLKTPDRTWVQQVLDPFGSVIASARGKTEASSWTLLKAQLYEAGWIDEE